MGANVASASRRRRSDIATADHPEFPLEHRHLERTLHALDAYIGDQQDLHTNVTGGSVLTTRLIRQGFGERAEKLRRVRPSPYVARVDFQPDGSEVAESLYFGEESFEVGDVVVRSWQAPIAGVFYGASTGSVTYRTPAGGSIGGRVWLKRHLTIEQRELEAIEDEIDLRAAEYVDLALVGAEALRVRESLLTERLSRGAASHLRDIIATIQPEQYELIRAEADQVLAIQGAAGSGKTSVALHRLSFLLFPGNEDGIEATRCIIFGPNQLYLRYISAVLPTLDVERIKQSTLADWAKGGLNLADRKWCDRCMDVFLSPRTTLDERLDRYRRTRVKTSVSMAMLLDRYVDLLREQIVFPAYGWSLRAVGAAEVDFHYPAAQLAELQAASAVPALGRHRERFLARLVAEFDQQYEQLVKDQLAARTGSGAPSAAAFAEAERALDDAKALDTLAAAWRGGHGVDRSSTGDSDVRAAVDALSRASAALGRRAERLLYGTERSTPASTIERMRFDALTDAGKSEASRQVKSQLERLCQDVWPGFEAFSTYFALRANRDLLAQCGDGIFSPGDLALLQDEAPAANAALDIADLPALHYLHTLVYPPDAPTYDHIVIDEAQDVSPLELLTLKRFSRNGAFTLLGDLAQGIHSYRGVSDWEDLQRVFDDADRPRLALTVERRSYRTTREITTFANHALASIRRFGVPVEPAEPFGRQGSRPLVTVVSSEVELVRAVANSVANLRAAEHENIALITRTPERSAWLGATLPPVEGSLPPVVTDGDFHYEGGVVILPAHLAKGLEFDAVVVVDASADEYPEESRLDAQLLYVALTRAIHELHVHAVGRLSSHLSDGRA
jgi:DNA helicase IV